jgi:phospholipid-binding lipoprotein MlaA
VKGRFRTSLDNPLARIPVRPVVPVLLAGLAALSACTPAPPGGGLNDPYEATNRQIHDFNKDLDRAIVRPLGLALAELPEGFREPVINFSDNVGLPGKALNGLLQGDIPNVVTNTLRFVLNSTVGLGGLLDPASFLGIEEIDTDFGETLAVWGVPEGAYREVPFFGPSTERDSAGRIVDILIDPLGQVGTDAMARYGTVATLGERVIDRGVFGGTVDSILYDSADSYAQARLIYLQNRRFELGEAAGDDYVDPYGDAFVDPYEATE